MTKQASWNIGDSKESDQKKGFKDTTGASMVGDPSIRLLDVILCTPFRDIFVEIEAPMKIILDRRVLPNKKNNVETTMFEILQTHGHTSVRKSIGTYETVRR
jgi:hypothetical protein